MQIKAYILILCFCVDLILYHLAYLVLKNILIFSFWLRSNTKNSSFYSNVEFSYFQCRCCCCLFNFALNSNWEIWIPDSERIEMKKDEKICEWKNDYGNAKCLASSELLLKCKPSAMVEFCFLLLVYEGHVFALPLLIWPVWTHTFFDSFFLDGSCLHMVHSMMSIYECRLHWLQPIVCSHF